MVRAARRSWPSKPVWRRLNRRRRSVSNAVIARNVATGVIAVVAVVIAATEVIAAAVVAQVALVVGQAAVVAATRSSALIQVAGLKNVRRAKPLFISCHAC